MILFIDNFEFELSKQQSDPNGRWLVLNLITKGESLCIVNLYGPNTDEPRFFDILKCILHDNDGEIIIMVGDFYTSINNAMDRKGRVIKDGCF